MADTNQGLVPRVPSTCTDNPTTRVEMEGTTSTESSPAVITAALLLRLRRLTQIEDPKAILIRALESYEERLLAAEKAAKDVILSAALSVQPASLDQILHVLWGDQLVLHPKSEKISIARHLRNHGWVCRQVRPSRIRIWTPPDTSQSALEEE